MRWSKKTRQSEKKRKQTDNWHAKRRASVAAAEYEFLDNSSSRSCLIKFIESPFVEIQQC